MLRETLDSLALQTFPSERFEVIIVDDGSSDGTEEIINLSHPYQLRYFWQENQGDVIARNVGALESHADVLVSLDDDMVLEKDYLKYIVEAVKDSPRMIVSGAWYRWPIETNPLLVPTRLKRIPPDLLRNEELPFTEINTHSLAIHRKDLIALGLIQDLGFPGSRMWSDVDLAYRAFLDGYKFIRVGKAIIWHRDYVFASLSNRKQREYTMGYRAVCLFEKHPELIQYLPMFEDKSSIDWRHDTARLVFRKVARQLSSNRLVLWIWERAYAFWKTIHPESPFLDTLIRWIVGGSIYKGYRRGLKELNCGGRSWG
jgi:glycosyltransferase involved in cell wall biosynthesis